MKKVFKAVLVSMVLVLGLAACTPAQSASAAGNQMANPMHEWKAEEFEAKFQELGVEGLKAPEGAESAKYFTYDSGIAEIQFTIENEKYNLRGSKNEGDITGLYEEFEGEAVKIPAGAGEAELKTTKSGGKLAAWKTGDVQYCLYGAKSTDEIMTAAVASVTA